uniref:Uncharacterized protein n=1 Tax=Timema douglasi TaxID=61478 RepID=A0A7R8ZE92_TIMDO|nr:unnamed protein product [Timema douglasi]
MSFFIRGKTNKPNIKINGERKRKSAGVKKGTVPPERKPRLDEELDSEDEDVIPGPDVEPEEDSRETTQEKRLRLAKLYLSEIEQQESERLDSGAVDRATVAQRLKENVLEQSGRLRRTVADNYSGADTPNIAILRCKQHKLAITCMALSPDDKFLYSGSKDCNIVQCE